MSAKILPRDITSYDLFKAFAVVFMIIDHVGYYLFPDEMWWRVLGRFCVPVWFFLVGYAKSRDLGPRIWIGMLILVAGNFVAGMSIFGLNILATMIVVRLTIDPIMKAGLKDRQNFWGLCVALLLLTIPTGILFEYGTQAVLMAIFGWLVRHSDEIEDSKTFIPQYLAFALSTFVLMEEAAFRFDQVHLAVLCMGLFIVMGALLFFRPATYPALTKKLGPLAPVIRFAGRRTLEIYVAHLVLLKMMALFVQPEYFILWNWKWFSTTGV